MLEFAPGRKTAARVMLAAALLASCSTLSFGDTLEGALARAYTVNPTLNAQRAATRATDEAVPQALSGYRPRVFGTADIGASATEVRIGGGQGTVTTQYPRGVGASIEQNIFDGFRTPNRVRAAEWQVLVARETLRNTEQNVLFDAVEAYMNVLRDFAIHNLRRNNVELLSEDLRATRERFEVGEVTRTDVAQGEARLAGARSMLAVAEANLKASRAIYRQRVGDDPGRLHPGRPIDSRLPRTLDEAINIALRNHPAVLAALYAADAAHSQVKIVEGELYPTVGIEGSVSQRWEPSGQANQSRSASVVGRVTVPIYQGGQVSSRVREAKEIWGQRQIEADITRDQVRAAVISAWGSLDGAKAQIVAAQAQVEAAQIALNGVREEANVGQRTTLDVLNAQAELLDARVALITAQRDRVVASYAVYQAIGQLGVQNLGVQTASYYDPAVHYDQVRDKWFGLRTPDGR